MHRCLVRLQFRTILSTFFFLKKSKLKIMESYWCTKKNSIIDMMNGKKIPLALSPCRKFECDRWREGLCTHIRKAGFPHIRVLLANHEFV